MGDPPAERHPEADELQRWAEGAIDAARHAALMAHVEACDACRAEIDEMRRVTGLLCLASAPPADLFERVKARRASGERVLLPTVSATQEESAGAATLTPSVAVPLAASRRPWHRRRAWGWVVGPLGVAATVFLVARVTLEDGRPSDQGRLRTGGAIEDSLGAKDSAAAADSAPVAGGTERGALVSLRETPEGLVIRLAAAGSSLAARQAQALDSAVSILRRDRTRRVIIRYVDPAFNRESASWYLASQVADRFTLDGIDQAQVRLVRVQGVTKAGLPSHLDAIEIVVN